MSRIDILSPTFIGSRQIGVTVDPSSKLVAGSPINLLIDYARTERFGGVVLPILVTVIGVARGNATPSFSRTEFSDLPPDTFSFTPAIAGDYLITVKESAHNRLMGSIRLAVSGDPFSDVVTDR